MQCILKILLAIDSKFIMAKSSHHEERPRKGQATFTAIRSRAQMNKSSALGLRPIVVVVVLAGCALIPVDGPGYTAAPPSEHGDAIIYLYRQTAIPLCCTPTVYMDDLEIFSPPKNSYTSIYVREGQHKLVIDWAWRIASDLHCNLSVKPGESYFIRIEVSFSYPSDRAEVTIVQETEAERELQQCCRYLAPVNSHIHAEVSLKTVPARFCGGEHYEASRHKVEVSAIRSRARRVWIDITF
jgi:hypothetical protein